MQFAKYLTVFILASAAVDQSFGAPKLNSIKNLRQAEQVPLPIFNCSSSPEIVTESGTHLVNPSDLKNRTSCEWRLRRTEAAVCQARLDFVSYSTSLGSEAHAGSCQADTLYIVGASNAINLGSLCGNLTGQHVYLDFGNCDTITLYNYIAEAMNQEWDIQVTFIPCDSPQRAPDGCLQYYTDPTGIVMSFNYPNQQMGETDYAACIKAQPGMSKITVKKMCHEYASWDTCGGFNDFIISGTPAIEAPPGSGIPPIGVNPVTGTDCNLDWVQILGVDKYCGNSFLGPITSKSQPFILQVHFNGVELDDGDDMNLGFCMTYKTSP